MQIEYKMEDFLCSIECVPIQGICSLVGEDVEQTVAVFSSNGYTDSFKNSVTLQHCAVCGRELLGNQECTRRKAPKGHCPLSSVCTKLGTRTHPGSFLS